MTQAKRPAWAAFLLLQCRTPLLPLREAAREPQTQGAIMKSLVAGCLVVAGLAAAQPAHAAELKVLAAEVVEGPVAELAAQFEKSSGHKLKIEYGFGVAQTKRAQGGETFDVIISPTPLIKNTEAVLAPGSVVALMRVGQGVAVKKGAAKPDVSSPDAFKATLLKAKSITFVPTGASGGQTLKVFDKLGIAAEMKAKTNAQEPATLVATVAKGDAELVLFLNNYLVGRPELDYVGPYRGDLQQYLPFSAGISAKASDAVAAQALVKFLAAPAATPVIKAKGMEPG
jgi:molybdate transport system substrate-binding protein